MLDLNEEQQVEGYVAGEVIKEHLHLRDRTCVFPHCTYAARACDCDHIDPWQTDEHGRPVGGPTCTCNLAALCRTHHRWKTHGHRRDRGRIVGYAGWSYERLGPGTYYWQGPRGLRFLRTPEGTVEVTDQAWHYRDLQARYDDLDLTHHERYDHEHEHEHGLPEWAAVDASSESSRRAYECGEDDLIETVIAEPPRR